MILKEKILSRKRDEIRGEKRESPKEGEGET
jgi:hypothetical protein